jgi:hypothetical protein
MNDRYFGCRTCKTYTNAGHRWARYQLEDPGIVQADRPVVVKVVLDAVSYCGILPKDTNANGIATTPCRVFADSSTNMVSTS